MLAPENIGIPSDVHDRLYEQQKKPSSEKKRGTPETNGTPPIRIPGNAQPGIWANGSLQSAGARGTQRPWAHRGMPSARRRKLGDRAVRTECAL